MVTLIVKIPNNSHHTSFLTVITSEKWLGILPMFKGRTSQTRARADYPVIKNWELKLEMPSRSKKILAQNSLNSDNFPTFKAQKCCSFNSLLFASINTINSLNLDHQPTLHRMTTSSEDSADMLPRT